MIKFRPYLKTFKVSRKIPRHATQQIKDIHSKETVVFNTERPSFNLSFSVVSSSISEAKWNHEYMQRLIRMIWAPEYMGYATIKPYLFIKFANLINSDTILGVGKSSANSESLKVLCKKISFKPDFDLGFFEHNGMLYIKSFDLSLDLETLSDTLLLTTP